MEIVPEPEVSQRSWIYRYNRPEQGWPGIERPAWPEGGHSAKLLHVDRLVVCVFQYGTGAAPELSSIHMNGRWPNGNPATTVKVHHDVNPAKVLTLRAPEWVLDIAADAVERSKLEVRASLRAAEFAAIERLGRGEAVDHRSACGRPGCWHSHVHHRHRTRVKPCGLCGCEDLIDRRLRAV
jgi:hypothetical protein